MRAPVLIVSIFILLIVCNIVLLENKEIWFEVYGLQNRRENGHLKKVLEVLDHKYSSTLQSSTSTITFNF